MDPSTAPSSDYWTHLTESHTACNNPFLCKQSSIQLEVLNTVRSFRRIQPLRSAINYKPKQAYKADLMINLSDERTREDRPMQGAD